MSQKTSAAAACQLLGQTHYLFPLFVLYGIFSGKFCQQSDFLYYRCIFSLSILLSSHGSSLLLQFNRLPLPCARCLLFITSLLLKPFFSSVFTCFSVTEVTGLIQEKIDKLWGTLSLILASLFFLCFNYIFFILRFWVCWPSMTLLVSPCRWGCILIHSHYPPCFSHHFSIFLIIPFTIKIMFYFVPLKKNSLSPLLPLSKFTLQSLSWVSCPDSILLSVQLSFQNLSVHLFIPFKLQSVLLYWPISA